MVVGPDNATIPLFRITTTFSGPNDIAVLGSTNETTFTVVFIPHPLFTNYVINVYNSHKKTRVVKRFSTLPLLCYAV